MKACSFLPAVTQMIYDMNLQHHLCGVTFECPQPARSEKEVVIHCLLPIEGLSSDEIDRAFTDSKHGGHSLYEVDENVLQKISPDIIFTQDVCEACQIDTPTTMRSVAKLKSNPRVVAISPSTLEDVFASAMTIATALGEAIRGVHYIQNLKNKIEAINQNLLRHQLMPKRVSVLEWINPLYNCGHWITDQVAFAGGIDMLSNPHGDSCIIPWEKIRRYNPQVIVAAPCGFSIERTLKEIDVLTHLPEWSSVEAVKNDHVFVIDYELLTQPSASTLVRGIEVLASLFHPLYFSVSDYNPYRVKNISYSTNF